MVRSSASQPPPTDFHSRLREVENFVIRHEETLESIPAMKDLIVDLRLGVERMSTTMKVVSAVFGLGLTIMEILHWWKLE